MRLTCCSGRFLIFLGMHETGSLSIYRAWLMLEYRTQLGLVEREDTQNWIKPKIIPPLYDSWGGGGVMCDG